ncbi:hypothetical protein Y032_0012g1661 [Ancylostoma ceylanicum]|uniref:Uncharacterized protein n=1 Tax=Ancylostoma ceylanicum TaxID=53326 RepID=A0A016VDH6_9BILA|nr:hypothetical protein Y032_0012g1661 [Ancylostoma ceylanicum]
MDSFPLLPRSSERTLLGRYQPHGGVLISGLLYKIRYTDSLSSIVTCLTSDVDIVQEAFVRMIWGATENCSCCLSLCH